MNGNTDSMASGEEAIASRYEAFRQAVDSVYDVSALLDLVDCVDGTGSSVSEGEKAKLRGAVGRTVALSSRILSDVIEVMEDEEHHLFIADSKDGGLVDFVPVMGVAS
ncbi:hypothetical protein FJU08_11605 [Martelella alba]|uniref:Uncharacterized protein n=1 Tax=Martelella alba TaxID=2590451 RepID=A0A506U9W3_9HYPH|nr:hypothetical protein [Martelella alba]TPW30318.1 hypothetical protein FJU08_11605 [Martelella alba]